MSATNTTTYYEFPVFVGSDKPAWLVDWNGAMNAIDSAIHEAKAEADANATNIASLQSSVTSLSGSVESQGSSITSLTQSLTSLQGTVNTITSLIGNGEPTTQDKTIIGAINELKADIDALDPSGQGVQAENVGYDNTDSGLTATNVQDAIDEVNGKITGSVDADDVTYDNTDSGLTATNVQDAIDELAQGSTAPVVKATSSGATFADHVTSLVSAWTALTSAEKYKAFIEFNTGGIAILNNVQAGTFSIVDIEAGTLKLTSSLIDLTNSKYYYVAGGTTYGDLSSTAIPSGFNMKLCV